MTTEYLLDTNACIAIRDLLAGKTPRDADRQRRINTLRAHLSQVSPDKLAMSQITLGELHFGVVKSKNPTSPAQFAKLRAVLAVVPLSDTAAEHYGQVRAHLESSGQPIGPNDTWIAALALATGRTVVTNNLGEFSRVPKLTVEDWTA